MSSYDTDYDSDTSNEEKPRQVRPLPSPPSTLERIEMKLEELMIEVRRMDEELKNFEYWDGENIEDHVRNIDVKLFDLERMIHTIRANLIDE